MEGSVADSSALPELDHSAATSGITPADYDKVVRQFNDTAAALLEDGSVHGRFESQVELTPHAIALAFGDERLTYAQLNCRANQVAHALLAQGVRAEERVGIYAERGVETVVGMLAVLKSGGAYVPLDPSYPAERLNFMSRDSSLVAILTTGDQARQLPIRNVSMIVLDQDLAQPDENPRVPHLTCRNLAYVMYTSGSTGLPKGVLVEHRGILRLVLNVSYAQILSDDCVAHCASPSFDIATWEVWGALLNGARVLIVPQRSVLNPSVFGQILVRNSVTAMVLPVGLFNEYVDALEQAFGGMRHLLVGGDKLVPSIVARALAKPARPQHFLNAYGPTEATTYATTFEIPSDISTDATIPIGKPISNTQIYILDDNRSPVPIGVTGEIFIGGAGVARGYLGRPELTAERFISDPFSRAGGASLYRTGDLARWRADGNVEFLGRRDFQLKIRGVRIEAGEIEITLQRHPGVKQAVVVARENKDGVKQLVAYVVAESSGFAEQLVVILRDYLARTLPQYMASAAIVILDKFPLTHNGKVDRGALPSPDTSERLKPPGDPAQTPVEQKLTEIWEQVLKRAPIGANDSFFEQGGDSMMGLELIAKISELLNINELSVIDLFEHPSAREMAQFVETLS
jgi:amino acid adenylation domain-containing protein